MASDFEMLNCSSHVTGNNVITVACGCVILHCLWEMSLSLDTIYNCWFVAFVTFPKGRFLMVFFFISIKHNSHLISRQIKCALFGRYYYISQLPTYIWGQPHIFTLWSMKAFTPMSQSCLCSSTYTLTTKLSMKLHELRNCYTSFSVALIVDTLQKIYGLVDRFRWRK